MSLVLAAKDEEVFAEDFFRSIRKQTRQPDEVILVDSSTDNTPKIAKRILPKIKLYRTKPVSAGYQRQYGVERAMGDIVLFIDVDAVAYPDWIAQMAGFFEAHPEANVAVGKVFFKEIPAITPPAAGRYYMNHCNAGYRRKEVFSEFKVDAEQNWDDKDMGYRVGKKHVIYGVPEARVYHIGSFYDLAYTERKFGVAMAKLLKKYRWHPHWVARWLYNLAFILFVRRNVRQFFYCIAGLARGVKKVYFG